MAEKNPLQISKSPPELPNSREVNKRGRPAIKSIVMFGPQPRSIMAQMLSEAKRAKTVVVDKKPVRQEPRKQEQALRIPTDNKTSQDVVEVIVSCEPVEEQFCPTCSERSCNNEEHKQNQTSHQKFECDYPNCGYSCKISSNLIKHKRVHTNEKPYLCDRCSFRTNFVNSLKAHKRIHTAEKPYQCEYCTYKCNSSSNLKKHCHLRHSEGNKRT